uniref:F5/8 type C domain-containing protein n=2 Tax=Steinernema glaseri TaxID=37863 RepID=A0A1I8AQE5_9BILA
MDREGGYSLSVASKKVTVQLCKPMFVATRCEMFNGHCSKVDCQLTHTYDTMAEPTENVVTMEKGCTVIEGRKGQEDTEHNCIINGEFDDKWGNYYVHTIGEGAITVRLDKPYMLENLGFLLWPHDIRWYHYYVETSVDGEDWERVADKAEEKCAAWQYIEFERRPVQYIKLVGTATDRESNRFLLWPHDIRWYHYYVETSVDGEEWERVADKAEEECAAWQYLEFERRPVQYIKLVGTATDRESNRWFHVVHIEAPAEKREGLPSVWPGDCPEDEEEEEEE